MVDITTTYGKKVSFESHVLYVRNENKYPKRDFIIPSSIRLKILDEEHPLFVRFALDETFCIRVHSISITKKNIGDFANFHKASIKEFLEWKRLFNDDRLDFDSDAYVMVPVNEFLKDNQNKNEVTWEKVGKK